MKPTKRLSLDSIDVENETEVDALLAQVLADGNKNPQGPAPRGHSPGDHR